MDKKVPVFIILYGSIHVCSDKKGQIEEAVSLQTPASISKQHQRELKGTQGQEEI